MQKEEKSVAKTRERRQGKSPAVKKIVIALIVIAVAAGAVFAYKTVPTKNKQANSDAEVSTDTVMRGDVSLTITGSAAVEPYERYEIIAKGAAFEAITTLNGLIVENVVPMEPARKIAPTHTMESYPSARNTGTRIG